MRVARRGGREAKAARKPNGASDILAIYVIQSSIAAASLFTYSECLGAPTASLHRALVSHSVDGPF